MGSSSWEEDRRPWAIANSVSLCPQYFVFLLLILIAQVTVGVLFYFNAGKVSALLSHFQGVRSREAGTLAMGQTGSHSVATGSPGGHRQPPPPPHKDTTPL